MSSPDQIRALVLQAFDTLFNRRDYTAAAKFWSPDYLQHSAHIPPGRDGLFNLVRAVPPELRYENHVAAAHGDYVLLHGRFTGHGRSRAWVVGDVVRVENGMLVEHWDTIQDECTKEESLSGLPMFGDRFSEAPAELTVQRARTIVAPLYDALNQPQLKDVRALLAQACHPDYKSWSTNAEWLSRDALADVFGQIGANVPDLAWSITDIMVSGDRVIVCGEATGTPVGEFFGVHPTGRSFRTMALDVFSVRGDKLASAYHVENWVGAIQQIQRLQPAGLNWDVFVTPGIPVVTPDRPAGMHQILFQAMASTLIFGERDAVLVDAFMTVEQARALADWVASKNRNLTTIYITHGHGDHWFGTGTLLERFPDARVVATPNTVKVMRQNASPEALNMAWKAAFPRQIPDNLVMATELDGTVIHLEGHELRVVELGHTDTDHTTCLHVPSLGLVVAGDAAYNDVHLYLVESDAQKRKEWIAALDTIESLNPRAVVATHKRPENDDHPRIIEETRQYIRDFDRLVTATKSAQELYDRMLELHPGRVNPGYALWSSARASKP